MILLYTLGTLNGRESERREQTPASYSQSAKADAERACVGLDRVALFECVYERVEASQEQARGEQDLSAQQRAATSALASTVIAFLTLVITAVGVWFVKGTLEATLEAVKDTSEATEAMRVANRISSNSQRPWIDIEPIFHCEPDPFGSVQLRFGAAFKNVGSSMAYEFRSAAYLKGGTYSAIQDAEADMFNELVEAQSDNTLVPGKEVVSEIVCDGLNGWRSIWAKETERHAAIIAVAVYKIQGEERIRYSRTIRFLTSVESDDFALLEISWEDFKQGWVHMERRGRFTAT